MNKILIIIPAFNESKNLKKILPDLKKKILKVDIIVVSDASSDDTVEVAKLEKVFYVSHPINLGIGGAVQTGMKFAVENNYDIAIQFDGDGQHLASEINTLIRPILNDEADMVIGSRYILDKGYKTPLIRRIGMLFSAWLTSIIVRQKLTDITSGFRAWNKKALSVFSKEYPSNFAGVESNIHGYFCGVRIKEIPCKFEPRQSGKSSINFWRSFYYPFKTIITALGVVLRANSFRKIK
ncbi:MAG: glycosyltransferase family 2 protein [Melioribacter sp.]|nr:glycosyltransferase family 2 protein [Melioribacter sp.]